MKQTTIDVRALLPDVTDAHDPCHKRLARLVEARDGIESVRNTEVDASATVVIGFNPKVISLADVRRLVHSAGATLARRYGHLVLRTSPMYARRARRVENQLAAQRGVLEAGVSPAGVLRIEYDKETVEEEEIRQMIAKTGVRISSARISSARVSSDEHSDTVDKKHEHEHGGVFGERSELVFAGLCGVLLSAGWLLDIAFANNGWLSRSLYVGAYFFGAYYIVREAIEKIRLRQFEIDFLMILAAAGAAALGAWAEGALLLFLFAIGHALENYAMGRARSAIEALADLAPETAVVRRGDDVMEVPVAELALGDVVIVKTNQRIAADGFVILGTSTVDQSPITGESLPVDKRPVDERELATNAPDDVAPESRVFAGTINQSGALEIEVTHLASESTLARVVTMVSEAETHTSPTQQFTDKFERYFVPAVVALVALLLFAFVVVDEAASVSFYRAIAVLVAASPCALAIATPSAVLSGVARAARGGVLIKGGAALENLGRLRSIAFDKTGTLTEGRPRVTDVIPCEGVSSDELLRNAIAVEALSDHPLAAAVVRDGTARLERSASAQSPKLTATSLRSITGRGIGAMVDGETVHIGKDDLFSEIEGPPLSDMVRAEVEALETQGRTTMVVRRGDRYLGVIGLMDVAREGAKQMIADLRELGVEQMIMISGDNQRVADSVAREVGIDRAWGDLMPSDKVAAIDKLRADGGVAMVGDGVNDAPAMAGATVGIAMGAAGSAIALETADIALMADDLNHLPFAVGLSRQTSRIIRQNLWYSLGMVAILVPATLMGLRMGFAILLHEGSTLVVVFNALRLLAYRPR